LFFVSSILLDKEAMWTNVKFFEGYLIFAAACPWIDSGQGWKLGRVHMTIERGLTL
jgi:hypothetical protein